MIETDHSYGPDTMMGSGDREIKPSYNCPQKDVGLVWHPNPAVVVAGHQSPGLAGGGD
jgi:hypothetical protein